MTIKVKQQHINKGVRYSLDHCPVALAVKEALPRCRVVIASTFCEIDGKTYDLPQVARDFIANLDMKKGHPVLPFEFELPYEVSK